MAVDGLSEQFVLLDSEDRIVLTNTAWREFNRKIIDMTTPGTRFEDHLRRFRTGFMVERRSCYDCRLSTTRGNHLGNLG